MDRDSDKYHWVKASDGRKQLWDQTSELSQDCKNTSWEADGLMRLLTPGQAEQELIT